MKRDTGEFDEHTTADERKVKLQRALLECTKTGERIVIGEASRFIGRDAMNHLQVTRDVKVSKVHCGLTGTDHGVLLNDRSKNGTLIIGGEVLVLGPYVLLRGDATVRIGDRLLKFSLHTPKERSLSTTFGPLESVTTEMQWIFAKLRPLVDKAIPIHITGEAGTGKRRLAETIHRISKRAKNPFIVVDCKAFARDDIESELFGHGADGPPGAKRKESVFVRAEGGVVFINEVERLSLEAQARLLRVIEDKEVLGAGQSQARKVDVRIITANRQDLARLVNQDMFHANVYSGLCGVCVQLPPLRERRRDIELLTRQILTGLGHPQAFAALSEDTLDWMSKHDWLEGNIRQLQDVLSSAVELWTSASSVGRLDVETAFAIRRESNDLLSDAARRELVLQTLTQHGKTFDLRAVHREATRLVYEALAKRTGGNIAEMARLAHVSRQHIYKYHVNKDDGAEDDGTAYESDAVGSNRRPARLKARSRSRSGKSVA